MLAIVAVQNVAKLRPGATHRNEAWMETSLPTEVDGLRMVASRENPLQSYRASERTYKMLKPYGIVCRAFGTRRRAYDAIVVAGNSLDAFHDPNVCFPIAGWGVGESHVTSVTTRTRGNVPMTVMRMETPQGPRLAAFCYRSTVGMRASLEAMRNDWFWGELRAKMAQEGAFYRFTQLGRLSSEADLLAFASAYLDAASDKSGCWL
jgi:hypothetical protein